MMKMTFLFAFSVSLLLVGCASFSSTPLDHSVVKNAKVIEIEKKKKEHEESLQYLKDRRNILAKKSQMETPTRFRATPQNKKIEISTKTPGKLLNERQLYAELVNAYDQNNEIAFFSRFQSFLQNYNQSPLADDAIYLAGLMSLSNKNYGPSLRYFNQVMKQYPLSNKASAAMYAKGVALKKLNLTEESRHVFLKVRKSYPGSPEAMRAQTELKLIK